MLTAGDKAAGGRQAKSNPWFDPRPSFFNDKELLCVTLLVSSSEYGSPEELCSWAVEVLDAAEGADGWKNSRNELGSFYLPLQHIFEKRSICRETREQVAKAMQVGAAVSIEYR